MMCADEKIGFRRDLDQSDTAAHGRVAETSSLSVLPIAVYQRLYAEMIRVIG